MRLSDNGTDERLTKVSVALQREKYLGLVEFCAAAARDTGGRVTHTDVFRSLLDEMASDHLLRRKIIDRLTN